ncbi:4'-phosphopantetheinyl transferase family protein [Streptomyces sp. NPDC004609]|uniref:4'-phosphopantetheinyl transferase family protein n=1 Tax=Streptomyces sp. NPDC004609 TaxID=3364704 RepID=UPI0036C38180
MEGTRRSRPGPGGSVPAVPGGRRSSGEGHAGGPGDADAIPAGGPSRADRYRTGRTATAEYRDLAGSGAVHVWRGRAPDQPDAADTALLSADELLVVRRRSGGQGAGYAGAHAALRRILARYLGTPPRDIAFGRRRCPRCADPRHGRPSVGSPATGLDFNLSRSGPHWMVAVTAGRPVGVDLEAARTLDFDGSAALVMSPPERARLRSRTTGSDRIDTFFRAWTRKEAVVKASGVGVVADLRTVDVRPDLAGPVSVRHQEPGGTGRWLVQDLPAGPGLYAALAREGDSTGPVILRGREDAPASAPPPLREGAVTP